MKKVPFFYLCFFLLYTPTVFGQKQTDAKIRQAIEAYESEISKALSASKFYDLLDNYQEIIKLYERHHLNKLKLVDYYTKAGQVAYELKAYRKALKYRQKALAIQEKKLEPIDLVIPYHNIAETCKALKLYLKAVTYQEQIILILKDRPGIEQADLAIAYGNIGGTYEASRKYQLALEHFQKAAIMLDGNEKYKAELDYYQESIVFLEGKLAERVETFLNPKNSASEKADVKRISSKNSIAYNFYQEKKYAEALSSYNKLNKESETGQNWVFIAFCYYYLGDYSKSIEAHKKSVALSPDIKRRYDYYSNLGLVYAKNGQFEKAETAFEAFDKLSHLKNSQPALHYRNWGMLYALQDEKYEAIENLKIAIEWQFKDVEWLENDDSLDSIREEKGFKRILKKATKNRRIYLGR